MRIAFVTSCLQPARDGVGDYTASLAEQCTAMGHSVLLLALNDPFVGGEAFPGNHARFSASLPWGVRWKQAAEVLEDFAPEVISLQFVCYGFHPRGFCLGLAQGLKRLFAKVPVQITFHELWIGAEEGACWKDRLMGTIQRFCVLGLLRQLAPFIVHTTNPAYVALLAENGCAAKRLPLFGAIPVPESATLPVAFKQEWNFVMFGTLHPVWPPSPLLEQLLETDRSISLTHVGEIGSGEMLWERMRNQYGGRIRFEKLGRLPEPAIAEVFTRMDFGIATTPWELVGKSGSVAAMLEYGLPVIVNRDDVHYRGWKEEGYSPLLIKMGPDLGGHLERTRRHAPGSCREQVAATFLEDLKGGQ